MSTGAHPASWNGRLRPTSESSALRLALVASGWLALLLLSLGLAALLDQSAPSAPLAIGGGLVLVVAVALVVYRYDVAIAIGTFLLAVVLVEPAPSDALFGLVIAVAIVTGRFAFKRVPRAAVLLVTAIIVLNVLSLIDVIDWGVAARFFFITLYLGLFSLWLAGYLDRPTRSRRLVRAYLAAAVISASAASVALFVHFPGASALIGDGSRAKALFKDPNVFGPFLVPITVILAEELLRPRLLRMRRSMMLLCFLALVLGIVFSYSRAAWLNLAVAIIVLIGAVVLRRPDRRAISLVLVVGICGLAIAGAVLGTGSLGFLEERAKLQSYDTHRFAAQSRGLSVGLQHPLGIGPGQFDVVSPISSHSIYVRTLSEQGALGLAAIIALIIATMAFAALNLLRGRDTYGISAAALLAAWCGLVANSFFVDTLHWRHLWLVAALIWAGAVRTPAPADRPVTLPA
jgi:hypothetical protein